jgi:hypothetical protein
MQWNSCKKQKNLKTCIQKVFCKVVEWLRIWESITTCTETCWGVWLVSRFRIRESQTILGERESYFHVRWTLNQFRIPSRSSNSTFIRNFVTQQYNCLNKVSHTRASNRFSVWLSVQHPQFIHINVERNNGRLLKTYIDVNWLRDGSRSKHR